MQSRVLLTDLRGSEEEEHTWGGVPIIQKRCGLPQSSDVLQSGSLRSWGSKSSICHSAGI